MPRPIPALQELTLICHGVSAFDVNVLTDEGFKPNQKQTASSLNYNGGGVAPNTAVAAARLGCTVGFSGSISTDVFGEIQYQDLAREGVNLDLVSRSSIPSPVSIIIGQSGFPTSIVSTDYNIPTFRSAGEYNLSPRVILLDGQNKTSSLEWLALAKRINAITVLDAGHLTSDTHYLSRHVDIVISSRQFALEYAETKDLNKIIHLLSKLCHRFIVTLDSEGVIWSWEGMKGHLEAWQVDCIDGVGAGDAFHGAFCSGLINQLSFRDNMLLSSAAGAICCQGLGARETLPDITTVMNFMAGQPKPEIRRL